MRDRIADALERLPEREKLVIALYYYENLTLREIGEVLRVTESRVSQLHTKAVLGLRSHLSRERAPEPTAGSRSRVPAAIAGRSRYRHPDGEETSHGDAARNRFGTWRSSATEAPARRRCTRRCCSRPACSTVSAASPTARPRPTPSPTSRRARCRSRSTLSSFEWHDRKINLLDTPGEPSFVADALGALRVCESAVFVINAVMGVEVTTQPALEGRRRARHRPHAVREHARPRARRLLPHARVAEGRVRPARRRDRDPDRLRARVRRRDRPRRHEGLPLRRRRPRQRASRSRSPPERGRARPGLPREADGRGRRGLRRADGALPRGRGDLATRRSSTRSSRAPTTARSSRSSCGVATRNLGTNRLLDAIVEDLPSPVEHGALETERGDARAGPGPRAVRLRLQDPRRPVRRADQPAARLPGHAARTTASCSTRARTRRSGSAS